MESLIETSTTQSANPDSFDECSEANYKGPSMKYLVVTGGSLSGIGKGTTISCIGAVLKSMGFRVTAIKIDPYLNIDAGTISPFEHGEVYVLGDGGEVDLDLGNYERFLDITLTRNHNLTTGKIYDQVMREERKGTFLGKTVQVIPHITDSIQQWLKKVALLAVDNVPGPPDICLIEVGGTVGDIESSVYMEALQQFACKAGEGNFCLCHVSFLPLIGGEQKTKPTQNSIRELRSAGLKPDFIFCRTSCTLSEAARQKISMFGQVPPLHVIGLVDSTNMYRIPQQVVDQAFAVEVSKVLKLPDPSKRLPNLTHWNDLATRKESSTNLIRIGIIGKYTGLSDSYLSVAEALSHAAMKLGVTLDIVYVESTSLEATGAVLDKALVRLHETHGVICPGGFGDRGIIGKQVSASHCREAKKPYLGICLGMQTAIIEFCSNVLGWIDCNSEEFNPSCSTPVVILMPETSKEQLGGTMRLGNRSTVIREKNSIVYKLYGETSIVVERHRHRYEVNPKYISMIEEAGMKFVGQDMSGLRMEIAELEGHPFFVCTQYHPEFTSRPLKPNPCFEGLLIAAEEYKRRHS